MKESCTCFNQMQKLIARQAEKQPAARENDSANVNIRTFAEFSLLAAACPGINFLFTAPG